MIETTRITNLLRSSTWLAGAALTLHSFSMSGCATVESKNAPSEEFRAPASVDDIASDDQAGSEAEFRKFFLNKDPEQLHELLQVKLDVTEEAFFRGHSALKRFDKMLDEHSQAGASLETFYSDALKSGDYPRLLALREQRTKRQHQMAYFCRRFIEISRNPASPPEEARIADDALNYIGTYFRQSPPQFRAALFSLGVELLADASQHPALRAGVNRILYGRTDTPEDLNSLLPGYLVLSEVVAKIDAIAASLEEKNTILSGKIEESSKMIESAIHSKTEGRFPQSSRIEPGTGSDGNITGNGFPKDVWSLTFDDGPHGKYTNMVLKNLQDNGMHATFFMLAQQSEEYPKIAQSVKAAGNETANHSYTHAQLTKLSDSRLEREVHGAEEKLTEILGSRPKLFRCPYGAGVNVQRVRSAIAREKMVHVFWNVDSLDWQDHNPASIVARVKKQMSMSKGGVILFHDIHPQSVEASKQIMESFKSGGKVREMKVGDVIELLNNGAN